MPRMRRRSPKTATTKDRTAAQASVEGQRNGTQNWSAQAAQISGAQPEAAYAVQSRAVSSSESCPAPARY